MKTKFIRIEQEASNAVSIFLDLPESNYSWTAGQYISFAFNDNDDSHDNKHWFTIASAPEDKIIQITTRNTNSPFKTHLLNLKEGDELLISEPSGDFVWKESDEPKIFIAGGIGITPFHSIISSRKQNNLKTNTHLIYVNRDDNFVYKAELDSLSTSMPELKITYLVGQLDIITLESADAKLKESLIYLSGPEPMVDAVGNELIASGVDEKLLIRDWFPGYDANNF